MEFLGTHLLYAFFILDVSVLLFNVKNVYCIVSFALGGCISFITFSAKLKFVSGYLYNYQTKEFYNLSYAFEPPDGPARFGGSSNNPFSFTAYQFGDMGGFVVLTSGIRVIFLHSHVD